MRFRDWSSDVCSSDLININDSNPVANNDVDSVGIGSTITGNVITGAGGNVVGGADAYSDAPATLTTVSFGSTQYTVPPGGRTITTTNGVLAIGHAVCGERVGKYV